MRFESYIMSALLELKPGAEWTIRGDNYSDLEWLDKSQTKPTEEEINAKIAELEAAEPMKLLREERNRNIQEARDTWLGRNVHSRIIKDTNYARLRTTFLNERHVETMNRDFEVN